ncbi:MAG TPA: glycoside hydrolase family 75 protein [Candidatus Acidoferrales bacterium]|nr:glycoside hydrolase family 75 protein [Candidatus Acidoferrales bacterium]
MQRVGTIFLAIIFFCSTSIARQNQVSAEPVQLQSAFQPPANLSQDCADSLDAVQRAKPQADDYASATAAQAISPGTKDMADGASLSADQESDLMVLEQSQRELARCILANWVQGPAEDSEKECSEALLMNFEMRHDGEPERDIPIARLPGTAAFFFEAGMTIDADGAPNAYHPENLGLDDLANAGSPGVWQGLAKDANGEPFIQGPEDPYPGYYVSETALADRSKPASDPTRYVDASKIPFVVLPGGIARQLGARPGDFALVFNQRNGKNSFAIFGDVGPFDRIGEGSMALAENLGIRSDARNGGARRGILYLVFPGSGNGRPRTLEEINSEGQKLLQEWESSIRMDTCPLQEPDRSSEANRGEN